jgi:hypothetical protein
MNNQQLKTKVVQSADTILYQKGFIAPVDLLIEVGALTKQNYEAWRNGKVSYLEAVCTMNLSKLSLIMKELRSFANIKKLNPSSTVYNRWGKGPKTKLRFSKSGNEKIEKQYTTHYVRKVSNKDKVKDSVDGQVAGSVEV